MERATASGGGAAAAAAAAVAGSTGKVGAMSFMFRILRKRASLVFAKPSPPSSSMPPPPLLPSADHKLLRLDVVGGSFDTREPTSPEVSCMGRIKRSGGCGDRPVARPGRKEKRLKLAVWKFLIIRAAPRPRRRLSLPRTENVAADEDTGGITEVAIESFDGRMPVTEVPNVEPRKEVNLWKRRVVAPPPPLQLC